MKTVVCKGQPSWKFASNKVEAAITRFGGHLAPVRFRLPHGVVEPYSVAPWAEEKPSTATPRLLRVLRGDFFCAPFGGNETPYRGEAHPAHGESASAPWRFKSLTQNGVATELRLSLTTKVRPGRIDKLIRLRKGETALYCRHVISGMKGVMAPGHHATLKFPDEAGSGHISTSPIRYAQVLPTHFEDPARGGYNSLEEGVVFSRLDRVPRNDGGQADLSRYPARRGFEDLVMIVHEARPDFAWTAAVFPEQGYVWFSLKDPRVLRSTVFWISNAGRHYPPWSGRHVSVMGLEDVTAYFHYGLAESARANPVNRRGFPTSVTLRPTVPHSISYIMAVAAIPRGFKMVKTILPGKGSVRLVSTGGRPSRRRSISLSSMKRSEINSLIRSAEACYRSHGWALPPNPRWDVTDFGLGGWRRVGLVLVNLAEEPEYCEKLMYAQKGMTTPSHTHKKKKEDIICRWGRLAVQVWSGPPGGERSKTLVVPINHESREVKSGELIELEAGSRITLVPGVYHEFYPVSDECIIGEISTANDDLHDNFFVNPDVGRYAAIEEDEPALVRLVSDKS